MSTEPTLAPDAAIVLGFASTAMPFARTPAAEAERWLRILRIHGDVGLLLQALGVSDGSLEAAGEESPTMQERPAGEPEREDRDAVAQVAAEAALLAARRESASVATTDVLRAVMHVYGEDFDRVLRAHGTDRAAVLELLDAAAAA